MNAAKTSTEAQSAAENAAAKQVAESQQTEPEQPEAEVPSIRQGVSEMLLEYDQTYEGLPIKERILPSKKIEEVVGCLNKLEQNTSTQKEIRKRRIEVAYDSEEARLHLIQNIQVDLELAQTDEALEAENKKLRRRIRRKTKSLPKSTSHEFCLRDIILIASQK